MIVEQEKGTWEKITSRLRETPLIQELFKAQKVLADTEAGKAMGDRAKAARDNVSDKAEDLNEFWETSQNPWVYRASSIYDGKRTDR
jgi:import inner membrane translocase subunit TIM44